MTNLFDRFLVWARPYLLTNLRCLMAREQVDAYRTLYYEEARALQELPPRLL